MPVTSKVDGDNVMITISGRFNFNDHVQFRNAYKDMAASANYTMDMSNTEYMDSSALGMLLLLREHAGGDSSNIVIAGSPPDIKKILNIANFQKLFELR